VHPIKAHSPEPLKDTQLLVLQAQKHQAVSGKLDKWHRGIAGEREGQGEDSHHSAGGLEQLQSDHLAGVDQQDVHPRGAAQKLDSRRCIQFCI